MSDHSDNQIECTRCGAMVYYDLTRCPNCGLNFYQPEAGDWPETGDWQTHWTETPQPTAPTTALNWILAVGLGWMIAAGVTLLVHLLFWRALQSSAWGFELGSLVLIAGVALGAWVTVHLLEQSLLPAGAVVGLTSIATAILFDAFRQDLSQIGLVRFQSLLVWLLLVGVGLAIGWWVQRQSLRIDQLLFPGGSEQALHEQLLARVRYDQALVERLVAYEQQRAPAGNRLSWLRSALQRWERDNR